ncbi:MAG: alpha/beta hydrolase [Chloroflexi bacterium]|nr:alpha/beta hydrolase [Chloroflexota bacterium]
MATALRHQLREVDGVLWHWVEAGSGDPVVLLHGIPESWYCWHGEIPALAQQFRVLAIDLKGYGQSDKRDGDYSATNIARELLRLLDELGIARFRLGGHDWGSLVGDRIGAQAPERVVQYVRASISTHVYDPRNSLHHLRYQADPAAAARLFSSPDAYVRVWFESSCSPATRPGELEMARIVEEFGYPGVGEAVARYFRDLRKNPPMDFSKLTFPVLIVAGEHDPRQPLSYLEGVQDQIPGLDAVLVLDCGHFVTHERPAEMAQAMLLFYNHMLGAGTRLFDRTRELGLPTRPKGSLDAQPRGMTW